MCAGIAVGLGDGQAKLLILELLEKGDATLPAHRCLAQVTRAGEVGRAFLIARKGEIFAHRSLLSAAMIPLPASPSPAALAAAASSPLKSRKPLATPIPSLERHEYAPSIWPSSILMTHLSLF